MRWCFRLIVDSMWVYFINVYVYVFVCECVFVAMSQFRLLNVFWYCVPAKNAMKVCMHQIWQNVKKKNSFWIEKVFLLHIHIHFPTHWIEEMLFLSFYFLFGLGCEIYMVFGYILFVDCIIFVKFYVSCLCTFKLVIL